MKKFLVILLALTLVCSFSLVGCGDDSTEPNADDNEGSVSEAKTSLIYGRGGDSVTLDPAIETDGESLKVTKNIYDTLLQYKGATTEVEPALATSWENSDDGLTWTFHLREGVKFHDGTDFNADAVLFNFDRWRNVDNPYRYTGKFSYYAWMFGVGEDDVVDDIVAVDEFTVEFHLNTPQGPFLNNIAMPSFAIASPTAIETYGETYIEHPVGTGPFVFENWNRNDSITLSKNQEYWMEGYPLLEELIFKSIPDNSARFIALQSGDVDIIDNVNPDDVTLSEQNSDLKTWLRPSMNVGYLAFNTQQAPFDNAKVRQALNMAVDKEGIIDAFYNGFAEPAKNPLPSSLWGYNDDITDYEYDLDAAKALLAEAGYPDGFETDLWYMPVTRPYIPQPKKIAEVMQNDFAKIGVTVNLVTEDWATYLDKTSAGEHSMALLGWTGDNGDPDNFLYVLLDSDNAVFPDAGNIAYYTSPAVHELLVGAQQISDQAERTAMYEEAQVIIHEDAPWVPLVHSTPPLLGNKEISGFEPHPTGTDSFTKVTFE